MGHVERPTTVNRQAPPASDGGECLLIGCASHPHFVHLEGLLSRRWKVSKADRVESVLSEDFRRRSWQALFLLQLRPGEHDRRHVAAWLEHWPWTPAVSVFDSWCEGESRTGRPLAGLHRVPISRFPTWLDAHCRERVPGGGTELDLGSSPESAYWPRTATVADSVLASRRSSVPVAAGTVAIVSAQPAPGSAWFDLAAACGVGALAVSPWRQRLPAGVSALIWDAERGDGEEWQRWEAMLDAAPRTIPSLIVAGFLRAQDGERAECWLRSRGRSPQQVRLLAKPFSWAEGMVELHQLLAATAEVPHRGQREWHRPLARR